MDTPTTQSNIKKKSLLNQGVETDATIANQPVDNNKADDFDFMKFTYFTNKSQCLPLEAKDVSVTLTTQMSMDRIWIMKYQCQRWPSPLPISIAVYISANQTTESEVLDLLDTQLYCDLSRMKVSFIHGSSMTKYPVNSLRNLAIGGINTTHALYVDSDFVISRDLHESVLPAIQEVANQARAAIVVPVFEYLSNCTKKDQTKEEEYNIAKCIQHSWSEVPETRSDIMRLLQSPHKPKVRRGYQNANGKNKFHGTTFYDIWENETATSSPQTPISQIPCIKSTTYEPYLIVRVCDQLPEFPNIFKGWGWNKIIWIQTLLYKFGYKLYQIQDGFALHIPHPTSEARQKLVNHKSKPGPNQQKYLKWFETTPDNPDKVPICEDSIKNRKAKKWKKRNERKLG